MVHFITVTLTAVVFAGSFASGLKCNEGFNMNINGIPLYFWNERQCYGNSKCVEQDLSYTKSISGNTMNADVRYGACMGNAYVNYLDCESLFGKNSKFDPANLLDMIPEFETSLTNSLQVFSKNASASLKELLSNGDGTKAFVDGVFTFYENLGFNFSKAVPLKPSLVKLLSAAMDGQGRAISRAYTEFILALNKLDTANLQFSMSIRTFLVNVGFDPNIFQDVFVNILINRVPGLVKSIFPVEWQPELWYDVSFKFTENIDPRNWTKTTEDMVATFKSTYAIPADVAQYIYPILDALPDLAKGSQRNPTYVGKWSLDLLKKFSEVDSSSRKFSDAFSSFISRLILPPLQEEFKTSITWIPGLFYRMFPGDKALIQKVYSEMGDGFASFNFMNLSSPETKLSLMIKNVINVTGGGMAFQSSPVYNLFVVNFAKMFYDVMNVSSVDYTTYIDDFATVIDAEFKSWPRINAGRLISNLITTMGGTVPKELRPLLDNMQPVLTVAMEQPMKPSKLIMALFGITTSYKTSYPSSPFPVLVERTIRTMYSMFTLDYSKDPFIAMAMANQLNLELQYINIDFQFALIKSYDFTNDQLYQMAVKAWPDFGLYIRILKSMNSEDVKQLLKDIIGWMSTPPPHTTQGFVFATKPTFQRVTKSIQTHLGELRQSFAPNSCKFSSCDTDLCNALESATETATTPADLESTTAEIIVDTTAETVEDTTMIATDDEVVTYTNTEAVVEETTTDDGIDRTTDGTTTDDNQFDTTAESIPGLPNDETTTDHSRVDVTTEDSDVDATTEVDHHYEMTTTDEVLISTTNALLQTAKSDTVSSALKGTTASAVVEETTMVDSIDRTTDDDVSSVDKTTRATDDTTIDDSQFHTPTAESTTEIVDTTIPDLLIDETTTDGVLLTTTVARRIVQMDESTTKHSRVTVTTDDSDLEVTTADKTTEVDHPYDITTTGEVLLSSTKMMPVSTNVPTETPTSIVVHTERLDAAVDTTSGVRKYSYYATLNVFCAWLTIYVLYR